PDSKPLALTTHAVPVVPWLRITMHASGPPPAWPDEPHTVFGAGGGPPGGPELPELEVESVVLELLSAEPRMTPTTTRAAPTEAQPAQAMCARTQRRQPEPWRPPAVPAPVPGSVRPGPVRPWAGLRRRAGR